jgi:hypothetical protein
LCDRLASLVRIIAADRRAVSSTSIDASGVRIPDA